MYRTGKEDAQGSDKEKSMYFSLIEYISPSNRVCSSLSLSFFRALSLLYGSVSP